MKNTILTLVLVATTHFVFAQQDIHFSQFFNSSVALNPAEAGLAKSDVRVMANYRTQWSSINSPFKTTTLSVDAGLMERKLMNEYLGIGLDIFQDKSDETHAKTLGVGGSFSYISKIDRKSKLAFGLKLGFIQRSIDFTGMYWANQFDGQTFNTSIPSGLNFASSKVSVADIGAGVFYETAPARGKEFYAGISADHLTAPNVAFLGEEDKYLRRYTLKIGGKLSKVNSNFSVLPAAFAMYQGKNKYIVFGTDFKYLITKGSRTTGINKSVTFQGGGYVRLNDAVYGHVGMSYGDYAVSATFDLNISGLTLVAGTTGAMELMFIYTPAITEFSKRKRTGR